MNNVCFWPKADVQILVHKCRYLGFSLTISLQNQKEATLLETGKLQKLVTRVKSLLPGQPADDRSQ